MGTAVPSTGALATAVEDGEIAFRLADPTHGATEVKVWFDLDLAPDLVMSEAEGGWELRLPLPDLDCLEYLFDIDGEMTPDPGNPDLVEGAFGPHSWLAMPGYQPPGWLELEVPPGKRRELTVGEVDLVVWEPSDEPLPLLLVHDGAEMDRFGRIVQYTAALPPVRMALLSPSDHRDERYAANPSYAAALVGEVIPAVTETFATVDRPVLVGQSLGGLAALHTAWLYPGAFAGLMMQSGSFFTPVLDPQESDYGFFDQVVGFVASVHESTGAPVGFPPAAFTCGLAEENLANNRLMHTHLVDLGVEATWGEVRQGHTWTCWRDSLHPHLADLLGRVWP